MLRTPRDRPGPVAAAKRRCRFVIAAVLLITGVAPAAVAGAAPTDPAVTADDFMVEAASRPRAEVKSFEVEARLMQHGEVPYGDLGCRYDYRPDFARPPPGEVAAYVYDTFSNSADPIGSLGRVLRAFSGLEVERVAPHTAPPLFSQTTASPTFRHGPFGGQTIGDVAGGLRAGKVNPAELPVDVIVRNGETIGLNTRSMLALRRGGIDPSDWLLNDVTGVPGMKRLLTERLLRNHLTGGTDVLRITGAGPNASNLL